MNTQIQYFLAKAKSGYRAIMCVVLALAMLLCFAYTPAVREAYSATPFTRIYVMSLSGQDVIVVESDGMFGIIDSGESSDYPTGEDPAYPVREGTNEGEGNEDELFAFLDSLGISAEAGNLQFYIGTHPHSDHIGTAYEVIERYQPTYVYTPEYDDSYITDPDYLYDNQYVYDKLVAAAEETGAILVQHLDTSAEEFPTQDDVLTSGDDEGEVVGNPEFTLGTAHIQIYNYSEDYKVTGISDANEISYGVMVNAGEYSAFLAGDICNSDGDEDALAEVLGKVDVLKLGHHGFMSSGTTDYIEALDPDYAIQTGTSKYLSDETKAALIDCGTEYYPADFQQLVGYDYVTVSFMPEGIEIDGASCPYSLV